jgi:23S rRNA pseudouridine2605 synthase
MVLDHGAKRQIRVMFDTLGYQVTKLLRVRIGSLWLGDLEPGRWAILNQVEIKMLLGESSPEKPQSDRSGAPKKGGGRRS